MNVDREAVAQLVAESRARQGLPPRVTEPSTLRAVALLLAQSPGHLGPAGRITRP